EEARREQRGRPPLSPLRRGAGRLGHGLEAGSDRFDRLLVQALVGILLHVGHSSACPPGLGSRPAHILPGHCAARAEEHPAGGRSPLSAASSRTDSKTSANSRSVPTPAGVVASRVAPMREESAASAGLAAGIGGGGAYATGAAPNGRRPTASS